MTLNYSEDDLVNKIVVTLFYWVAKPKPEKKQGVWTFPPAFLNYFFLPHPHGIFIVY